MPQETTTPAITPAFEVRFVDHKVPKKLEKRFVETRIFRVGNFDRAKHAFVVWSMGEKLRTGIQYRLVSVTEVLAEPSLNSLAALTTRFRAA